LTVLYDLLPWLEGWQFDIRQITTPFVIPAGGAWPAFEKKGHSGYVLGLVCCANQPTTTLEIRMVGKDRQERVVTGSPFVLNALGFTLPNGSGFWTSVYNTVLGIYAATFNPDSRVGFWNDFIRVRVLAPATLPATVTYYSHTLVWVSEEEEWRKSLHELLSSDIITLKLPPGTKLAQ
jgi:hypothetical protein